MCKLSSRDNSSKRSQQWRPKYGMEPNMQNAYSTHHISSFAKCPSKLEWTLSDLVDQHRHREDRVYAARSVHGSHLCPTLTNGLFSPLYSHRFLFENSTVASGHRKMTGPFSDFDPTTHRPDSAEFWRMTRLLL